MSEDWSSLSKDLIVGVCAIFVIASALVGVTSYRVYTYNKTIDYAVENNYEFLQWNTCRQRQTEY